MPPPETCEQIFSPVVEVSCETFLPLSVGDACLNHRISQAFLS